MKFKRFINEVIGSSWDYKIPEDKEKMLYDFYMLVMLPDPETKKDNDGKPDYEDSGTMLAYNLGQARTKIMDWLLPNFQDALRLAVSAEFRHIFDSNDSKSIKEFFKKKNLGKFILGYAQQYALHKANLDDFSDRDRFELAKKMKNNEKGYLASLKAVESGIKKQGTTWEEFMRAAADAFKNMRWSSSYGGDKWAVIAKAYDKLMDAINTGSYGKRVMAIDHVYDLQHNTDTVFNKVKEYYKADRGYRWLLKALEKKKFAKDLYELKDDTSSQVRELMTAVIKNTEGRTVDDWLKSVEDKKNKEEKEREEKQKEYEAKKKKEEEEWQKKHQKEVEKEKEEEEKSLADKIKQAGKVGDTFKLTTAIIQGFKKGSKGKIVAIGSSHNNLYYIFTAKVTEKNKNNSSNYTTGKTLLDLSHVKWISGKENIKPDEKYFNTGTKNTELVGKKSEPIESEGGFSHGQAVRTIHGKASVIGVSKHAVDEYLVKLNKEGAGHPLMDSFKKNYHNASFVPKAEQGKKIFITVDKSEMKPDRDSVDKGQLKTGDGDAEKTNDEIGVGDTVESLINETGTKESAKIKVGEKAVVMGTWPKDNPMYAVCKWTKHKDGFGEWSSYIEKSGITTLKDIPYPLEFNFWALDIKDLKKVAEAKEGTNIITPEEKEAGYTSYDAVKVGDKVESLVTQYDGKIKKGFTGVVKHKMFKPDTGVEWDNELESKLGGGHDLNGHIKGSSQGWYVPYNTLKKIDKGEEKEKPKEEESYKFQIGDNVEAIRGHGSGIFKGATGKVVGTPKPPHDKYLVVWNINDNVYQPLLLTLSEYVDDPDNFWQNQFNFSKDIKLSHKDKEIQNTHSVFGTRLKLDYLKTIEK